MKVRKTFHLDANAHFPLSSPLSSSPRPYTEQAGTGGGLRLGQMSSDRRPRIPGSPRYEVVCFQHRTPTRTFIYPQGPAAPL